MSKSMNIPIKLNDKSADGREANTPNTAPNATQPKRCPLTSKAASSYSGYNSYAGGYNSWKQPVAKADKLAGFAEAYERVLAAFDPDVLAKICGRGENDFNDYGKWWSDKQDGFFFKDNGSPILAVAHLDSVQSERWCYHLLEAGRVYSPVLDDRLGVYTILELLPKMGIVTDILLAQDEEIGKSTASMMHKGVIEGRNHNWTFEFDRKGEDAVCYNFEDDALKARLNEGGWWVGVGSCSDISKLEHMGCKAINFGVGYHDYHDYRAYVELEQYFESVAKFALFHARHKDEYWPHEKKVYASSYTPNQGSYLNFPKDGAVGGNEFDDNFDDDRDSYIYDADEWPERVDRNEPLRSTLELYELEMLELLHEGEGQLLCDMAEQLGWETNPPDMNDDDYNEFLEWAEFVGWLEDRNARIDEQRDKSDGLLPGWSEDPRSVMFD